MYVPPAKMNRTASLTISKFSVLGIYPFAPKLMAVLAKSMSFTVAWTTTGILGFRSDKILRVRAHSSCLVSARQRKTSAIASLKWLSSSDSVEKVITGCENAGCMPRRMHSRTNARLSTRAMHRSIFASTLAWVGWVTAASFSSSGLNSRASGRGSFIAISVTLFIKNPPFSRRRNRRRSSAPATSGKR